MTLTDTITALKATALSVPPLTALAWEINDAHQEVQDHTKGMLLAAKRAGEKLLEAKKEVPHGQFKAWVEAHCRCSYRTAQDYMQVAKLAVSKNANLRAFEGGMIAFLREYSEARNTKPTPATPPFTQADAEYAQKLHAMSTRGTEHEATVAQAKLDSFAKGFGMTGEQVVEKAEKVNPTPEPMSPMDKAITQVQVALNKKSKKWLVVMLMKALPANPDLMNEILDEVL